MSARKLTMGDLGEVNPDDFTLNAKIDFLTIRTVQKTRLPQLQGKAIWPPSLKGTALTVHDATASDVGALQALFGCAALLKLEVAVDFRPRPSVPPTEHLPLLQAVMLRQFACELEPSKGKGMANKFRARYRHFAQWGKLHPFNMLLPLATDQLLYGHRDDPVQVKCYLKGRDQGKALAPGDFVARMEVNLAEALVLHDLCTLEDIIGFKFRKALAPYFKMVSGTRRHKKSRLTGDLRQLIHERLDRQDAKLWQKTGVGNFVQNGKGRADRVRLIRNSVINDRVGQALYRLEKQFHRNKSVCLAADLDCANPSLSRAAARFG